MPEPTSDLGGPTVVLVHGAFAMQAVGLPSLSDSSQQASQ